MMKKKTQMSKQELKTQRSALLEEDRALLTMERTTRRMVAKMERGQLQAKPRALVLARESVAVLVSRREEIRQINARIMRDLDRAMRVQLVALAL